jgi:putative transposase
MPSKNRIKNYIIGSYYHVYNRGVEKRDIFLDDGDYNFLLKKLAIYEKYAEIQCFCLMPNHFHFLLRTKYERGIERFARGAFTSYSMYFNRKYSRVGHLFQERYKARLLRSETDLASVISYIKGNPFEDGPQNTPLNFHLGGKFPQNIEGPSF